MRCILISLLVLTTLSGLPAQRVCYKCKGEGSVVCKKKDHDQKRTCGKWKFEHKCSSLFSAPCCRGTLQVHCERCNDPVAEAKIMERVERRASWVKQHKDLLGRAGIKGVTVETDNFRVHFMIPRWSANEARLTRNRAAHLFAYRLQKAADRFHEICGTTPGLRQTLTMCKDAKENLSFTLTHMGGGYQVPFRRSAAAGLVCTWPIPQQPWDLKNDENMHSHVVHLGTHLMHWASLKFHLQTVVWLDVGLCHWMELDQTKQTRNFCFNEGAAKDLWMDADWKKKIYSEVGGKSEVTFAALLTKKNLDQTDHRDHAYCWSFVDYLVAAHPEKFKKFYREMKLQNDTKKALDRVFNISTASFHDQWRNWVRKNYAPQ